MNAARVTVRTDRELLVGFDPRDRLRLRAQYRSLRSQVCWVNVMCVTLCVTCCAITLLAHAYGPACKEDNARNYNYEMQKQSAENDTKEDRTTRSTPFIHLTIKDITSGNLSWQSIEPYNNIEAYLSLDQDTGMLHVHQDGAYKVSLQISYTGREKRARKTHLHHGVTCYTDVYPVPLTLLDSIETVNFTSRYWKKTLFSEGIFLLCKGDRLNVWTNNSTLIDQGRNPFNILMAYPCFV